MSMEQQMQQHMEAGAWHELEDNYLELEELNESLVNALKNILPKIVETHPEIYIKYMNLVNLKGNKKD